MASGMGIGRMRHRIALQSPTRAPDAHGQQTVTFATVATVWASIEPARSTERFDHQQQHGETTHTIRIRAYVGLTPEWRIVFSQTSAADRTFEVLGVRRLAEIDRWMMIDAREQI